MIEEKKEWIIGECLDNNGPFVVKVIHDKNIDEEVKIITKNDTLRVIYFMKKEARASGNETLYVTLRNIEEKIKEHP